MEEKFIFTCKICNEVITYIKYYCNFISKVYKDTWFISRRILVKTHRFKLYLQTLSESTLNS